MSRDRCNSSPKPIRTIGLMDKSVFRLFPSITVALCPRPAPWLSAKETHATQQTTCEASIIRSPRRRGRTATCAPAALSHKLRDGAQRETVAIDALGEGERPDLARGLRDPRVADLFAHFISHRFVIRQRVPKFGHFRERINYSEFCDREASGAGTTSTRREIRLPALPGSTTVPLPAPNRLSAFACRRQPNGKRPVLPDHHRSKLSDEAYCSR